MAKQAWAQNAVIVEENGNSVRFRPRCPMCGHVPANLTMGGYAAEGLRSNYFANCQKCGKSMNIVISRG